MDKKKAKLIEKSSMISHSPMKNKKRSTSFFSPSGIHDGEPNIKKKKKPVLKKSASKTAVSSYYKKDLYTFNFKKLLELEYDVNEFDPYQFISSLPTDLPPPKVVIPKKKRNAPKITLVLDLDETLVHCATFGMKNYDLVFPVVFNGIGYKVFVKKRPFFKEFLEYASDLFEVIVFTASHETYANKLLDLIDNKGKFIVHRIFRDSCVIVDGNYLKDLTVLGRDLKHTIIIDNSPTAFGFQISNGIPIISWYEDKNDRELIKLIPFLEKCRTVDDVRPLITSKFKFQELISDYKKKMNKIKKLQHSCFTQSI